MQNNNGLYFNKPYIYQLKQAVEAQKVVVKERKHNAERMVCGGTERGIFGLPLEFSVGRLCKGVKNE